MAGHPPVVWKQDVFPPFRIGWFACRRGSVGGKAGKGESVGMKPHRAF